MQLKGFAKSNHKIGIFVIIISIVALVLVCTSFAFYNREANHIFISGTVGSFSEHDIRLAILVDGESNQDFPSKGNYDVDVDCGTNATGEWDYNKWGIDIHNMTGKSVTCSLTFTTITTFGVKREIESTSSAWERIEASRGKVANAQVGTTSVQNDFDNIYPWSDIKTYNYDTGTKEVTAWIDEAGFTFTPTGNVEVLTYIPEFYYRRYQEDGYEYVLISRDEHNGYEKSEAFSIGRYTMSGNETRVHSRSNQNPLHTHKIAEFRNYAKALGEGFQQLDYHYFIIQLLYLVEYADYNSQAKLGFGNVNNSDEIKSGGCDALGMHSGSADGTDKSSVIYRGIEDLYGNYWQYIDGINIRNNKIYICFNPSKYVSDKFDDCYKPVSYTNATSSGYISKMGYDPEFPMVSMPTEVGGTENTYITDHYGTDSGDRIAMNSGRYNIGTQTGLWFWNNADISSFQSNHTGTRLIKTGAIN